jgi:hypothetical protein
LVFEPVGLAHKAQAECLGFWQERSEEMALDMLAGVPIEA